MGAHFMSELTAAATRPAECADHSCVDEKCCDGLCSPAQRCAECVAEDSLHTPECGGECEEERFTCKNDCQAHWDAGIECCDIACGFSTECLEHGPMCIK